MNWVKPFIRFLQAKCALPGLHAPLPAAECLAHRRVDRRADRHADRRADMHVGPGDASTILLPATARLVPDAKRPAAASPVSHPTGVSRASAALVAQICG